MLSFLARLGVELETIVFLALWMGCSILASEGCVVQVWD